MKSISDYSPHFFSHTVLNIGGESGTGKTTLAMQLVGNSIKESEEACIWVQASERFPKKRAERLFGENSSLLDSFYLLPSQGVCSNYAELLSVFRLFLKPHAMLPPDTKYIVVDNISHHLRYELMQQSEYQHSSLIINSYFNRVLFPLITFCQHHDMYLVLIHEMSYYPDRNQMDLFLVQLYERIKASFVCLIKQWGQQSHCLRVKDLQLEYTLKDQGIVISELKKPSPQG